MKNINFLKVFTLIILAFSLSSCEAVMSIFNAGVGFGIFLVLALIIAIVAIIMRAGKNKS
jgi:hypothetical protein